MSVPEVHVSSNEAMKTMNRMNFLRLNLSTLQYLAYPLLMKNLYVIIIFNISLPQQYVLSFVHHSQAAKMLQVSLQRTVQRLRKFCIGSENKGR